MIPFKLRRCASYPSRAAGALFAVALLAGLAPVARAATGLPERPATVLHAQYLGGDYDYNRRRPDDDGYGRRRNEDDRYRRGQDDERYRRGREEDRRGEGGPRGSYQQSCGEVRMNGSAMTAVCGNGRGRSYQSTIDVNRCGGSDISNNRGVLQCGGYRGR